MAIEEMAEMPALGALLRRAAVGAATGAPAGGTVFRRPPPPPLALETELLVRRVTVDRGHLDRYERVCGFATSDVLPATYPHVVAFPLALELMTRTTFPFRLLGLVHVDNRVEQHRALGVGESLDIRVKAGNVRRHDRGRTVDVVTTVTAAGADVWRERSTYLRRQRGGTRPVGERTPPPTPQATWEIGVEVGRAYARVSGDRNPIHTSTLAARLFGYPRRIAHGMWSLARCLAELEGHSSTVDCAFKAPILLPATVAFASGDGWFALHDAVTGRPHLVGTVTEDR